MILYHTTHHANLFTSSSERETNPISCARFDNTHFAFAGEPLAGQGRYVYSVDIPTADAQPYLFKNDFRKEVTSHYALPWELVVKHRPICELYVDVTGVPGNVHVISVLDTHAKKGEKLLVGSYSLVWASREGVAKVKIHDRSAEALRVAVETTKDFNPEKDYIIAEVHEEFETPVGAAPNEAWILNTIAGFPPAWQTFPFAWQTWVHDLTVTESALTYLTAHMPRYRRDMEQAQRMDSKHNRARAWREIGDEMSQKLSIDAGREVTLGKFAGHSWTAVMALPLRMAMRLGSHVGTEWVPPLPKPEFQHPNESGRVLLANNFGAYPTQGPGVDYTTQDRPYEKRASELVPRGAVRGMGDFTTRPSSK